MNQFQEMFPYLCGVLVPLISIFVLKKEGCTSKEHPQKWIRVETGAMLVFSLLSLAALIINLLFPAVWKNSPCPWIHIALLLLLGTLVFIADRKRTGASQ